MREAEVADLWGRLEAQQPPMPEQVLSSARRCDLLLSTSAAGCSRTCMLWSSRGPSAGPTVCLWCSRYDAESRRGMSHKPDRGNEALVVQLCFACHMCWCCVTLLSDARQLRAAV